MEQIKRMVWLQRLSQNRMLHIEKSVVFPWNCTFAHHFSHHSKTPETFTASGAFCGTPDAIRTHDLQSRSLTLYPAELRAHARCIVPVKRLFVKGLRRGGFGWWMVIFVCKMDVFVLWTLFCTSKALKPLIYKALKVLDLHTSCTKRYFCPIARLIFSPASPTFFCLIWA